MLKINHLVARILIWRLKHIKNNHFIMLLSAVIGVFAGLAAMLLKTAVHYIEHILRSTSDTQNQNWLYLVFPLIGIFLTVIFVRTFIKDEIGHGVSKVLTAISKWKSNIKRHNTYSSIIACSFTGGFGGSVGMEAPILFTGSAIGSNLGQIFRLNYKTKTLLIGCGVAAAMAAIFKAPIAGFMFVIEVLMIDLTASSVIPLLIAAVTGAMMSNIFLGKKIEFYFTLQDPFDFANIPFYILLGLITGIISLYFLRMNVLVEKQFKKIINPYTKVIIGGVLVGILILIFPPLYGEGYTAMRSILTGNAHELLNNSFFYAMSDNQWTFLVFLLMILLVKVIATSATTGSGGIGGVFAPSLFMGGITGFAFARFINQLNVIRISESNFALVGMAGLIAGVIHAPLTAIFLIAEITGGYGLFIPLIITAIISYATIMFFEPHSLYTKKLAQKGELITHHKDKAVLSLLKVEKVLETNFCTVAPDDTLGKLVDAIAHSKRNIFPVVDIDGNFKGLVPLDEVREIMFERSKYNTIKVKDIMIQTPASVCLKDSLESVMQKFKDTGLWNLPVIDDGKYEGFVSRANVFNAYRRLLIEFTGD